MEFGGLIKGDIKAYPYIQMDTCGNHSLKVPSHQKVSGFYGNSSNKIHEVERTQGLKRKRVEIPKLERQSAWNYDVEMKV